VKEHLGRCLDADFQVMILDRVGSSAMPDDVLRLEECWKRKLLSLQFGLNGN
jgi:hypothetical protein